MSTRTLLTALFATALTMPALAQPATPPAAPPPAPTVAPATPAAPPAVTVEGSAPTATSVTRDKDTLSVDFPDEDIKTILRNVADLFELNIVVPDTLTGKTSIKLRDVSWRQIFHVILDPISYTYVEEGNIIKIISTATLEQEATATEVIILNNARAADIKPTIDGLIDATKGGKIVIDARSNALVITERPSRMGHIRSTIDQLDKATDQVMIESKFVEVTDRDIRNIGVNWAGLNNMTLGVGGISKTYGKTDSTTNFGSYSNPVQHSWANTGSTTGPNSSNNTVVTTAPPAIPATTTTNTTDGSATASTSDSVNAALNTLNSLTSGGGTQRLASAVFSASDFKVVINALKSQNNSKIVSNPTVVTLNNTEAILNIGQEFPIPNYTYNEQQGRFSVSGFNYRPIGIILKVTPQVNARGIIKLVLEPEVSQTNGNTTFEGANIPIIATRKAKTQVSLKDGYTMGIGGLITSSKSHGNNSVPVLGDIPLLGRLFSSKNVNDETTNLLIFITAKTVSADGAAPEEIFDPRAVEATGMSREDLPGHRTQKGTDIFAPPPAPANN
jgi:type IV pilus secretin PilQ/predicted competence protein